MLDKTGSMVILMAALTGATIVGAPKVEPRKGEVKVEEKFPYFNQPNCIRLSNGAVELVLTTDIGPRIIKYALAGQDNVLAEMPADPNAKPEEWQPYGGHRLWHAPEAKPRTYSPDNSPISYKVLAPNSVELTQAVEPTTGIQKQMIITLDNEGTGVTILHRLTNKGLWGINLAPWALTIMKGGGETILPQEPFIKHEDELLPARPFVLWHYSDLNDPRFTIGKRFVRLRTDEMLTEPQKIGIGNKQGWAGYVREKTLFIKRFAYDKKGIYPDYGCNTETYTAGNFMEVETLGTMHHLEPGEAAEHTERWFLFPNVDVGKTENELDAVMTLILPQTNLTPPLAPAPK